MRRDLRKRDFIGRRWRGLDQEGAKIRERTGWLGRRRSIGVEVTDDGMMELMPTDLEIHLGAIERIRLKIEEALDGLHAGARRRRMDRGRRTAAHQHVFPSKAVLIEEHDGQLLELMALVIPIRRRHAARGEQNGND